MEKKNINIEKAGANKIVLRLVSLLLISLLGAFNANAQIMFKVEGQVLDENKKPLPEAVVSIIGTNIEKRTDKEGSFIFMLPAEKNYTLHIKRKGYFSLTVPIKNTKNVHPIFVLKKNRVKLDGIVVVAHRNKVAQNSSSLNLISLDPSYVEKNFSGSLMESLENISGVKAMKIGSGQSKPVIRGLGFNRMSVVENGIKHEGQQWGEEHGLEVDQFALDRIEIIKGPASLLYGSDAIAGVINLFSDDVPKSKMEGKFNLFTQSNNESVGLYAKLAGRKNHFYYKVNATLIDYADYKVPTDSIQYYSYYIKLKDRRLRNTAGKEQDFGLTLGYISEKIQTSFMCSDVYSKSGFFANAHGLEVRLSTIDYDKSSRDIDLPFNSVNHFKFANHSTIKIGTFRIETHLAYQNNLRKEMAEAVSHGYMPKPLSTLERKFNKNTYTANFFLKYLFSEKHLINAGINAELQNNKRGGWGFVIPDFNRSALGAFIYDRYHISEKFILTAGVRLDAVKTHIYSYNDWYKTPSDNNDSIYKKRSVNSTRNFKSLTWSTGVNYHFNPWTLKVNVGKSFRVPLPKELGVDGVNYQLFRYEKGESQLAPEESYQFDIGLNWQNNFLNIEIDPFFNYFPNYIYLNPTSEYVEGLQMYYYTQSKVVRYGLEAELNIKLSEQFQTNFKGEYLYAQQLSGDKEGYSLPFSPPWSFDIGLKYTAKPKSNREALFVAMNYKLVGAKNEIVPPEKKTPAYQTLNMSVGKTFYLDACRLKVYLKGKNLLNKKYYDHTSYYRLMDVPEPGRNFSMMLGFEF